MTTTFAQLSPALLVESKTNARKRYNPKTLTELADSIKTIGVLQALLVRPLPGHRVAETSGNTIKPTHEIVAGHRRYRAANIAGLAELPVMIRHITDEEMYKSQSVENLHREGLSELDEGEGYADWMEATGIKAEGIAKEIERSVRYVYDRLRLIKLQPETKAALQDGLIDVSRALLLAPVHDPKLQLKALDYAATVPAGSTQPSVRDLAIWLRQNVMLDLARAPFQITAANLVPLAGSCKSCPKRTGADPDMFSHVDGADICTDPPCYNTKCEAHLAELQHQADKRHLRLVYGPEAKAICYEKSSTLNGYSPLSQVRNDLAAPYTGKRLDHLLSPSPTVPIAGAVLIENPYTRELIAAIPTADAEAALIAKGLVKIIDTAAPEIKADKAKGKKDVEADIARIKARTDYRIEELYQDLLDEAVVKAVTTTDDDEAKDLISAKLFIAAYGDEFKYYAGKEVLEALKLEDQEPDQLTEAQIYRFAALWLTKSNVTASEALAKENGVHLGRLRQDATEQIKAEVAAQIAALKPQKTPAPTSPLAQPSTTPFAHADADADPKTKPPKTAKPKAKAKLSAKDAQLGIAEAMQGIEAPPADVAAPVLKAAPAYTKGQQVKVATVSTTHAVWRQKYAGLTGTVKALNFDTAFDTDPQSYEVTFKGRTGGVADFTADELEAA